jgi:hypothetical protein
VPDSSSENESPEHPRLSRTFVVEVSGLEPPTSTLRT